MEKCKKKLSGVEVFVYLLVFNIYVDNLSLMCGWYICNDKLSNEMLYIFTGEKNAQVSCEEEVCKVFFMI